MGGRVVECAGLENRYGGNAIVGSNPTPSARIEGWHLTPLVGFLAVRPTPTNWYFLQKIYCRP